MCDKNEAPERLKHLQPLEMILLVLQRHGEAAVWNFPSILAPESGDVWKIVVVGGQGTLQG